MAALSFLDVRYRYPGTAQPALDGVSLEIDPGELVLVLGESGCGKSTLLRSALGLVPHFHGGELAGRVVVDGLDTRDHRPGELARHAGLVFQDPEAQLVAQRVRHEVAFGLESLGHPPAAIAARAQEALMAAGASHLTERDTGTLSGGEGQRIAIASVLAMGQPLLLLDEPTSQLDPVAAEELLALITRINRDRGVTVVLAEHRTGRLFDEADRVVVMDTGRIAFDGSPAGAARHLAGTARWMLPPIAQAFAAAGRDELPLTVRDARRELGPIRLPAQAPAPAHGAGPVVSVEKAYLRRGDTEALHDAGAGFDPGTVTVVLGENGAGKSSLALAAARLVELDRGRVRGSARAGYVSQNPAHHLLRETVAEEVAYGPLRAGVPAAERDARTAAELERFGLAGLADRHPRDLSSGERQRLAVASVTVMRPDLLILDEPTRGMDGLRKLALGELAAALAAEGTAVALITHDIDFAAEAAGAVTTMAHGRVLADRAPRSALAGGLFFAGQVALATGYVSVAEAAEALRAGTEAARV
jgi:energy-coupling factor transport system ATP-binding protein